MTEPTTPSVPPSTGNRARADLPDREAGERPSRCMVPKVDSGKPCKREAGSGTDHWGEGPCVLHDDGTWTSERETFAENVEAQEAFLEAVLEDPDASVRKLVEPLGYHRRDVAALIGSSEEFALRLEEAKGEDADTIRREWKRRAIACESDRLFELWVKTRLPEGALLRQTSTRFDGQLDVRGVPYLDMSAISSNSVSPERRAALEACESEAEVLALVVGWVNPSPEDLPRDGRPALELVAGEGGRDV